MKSSTYIALMLLFAITINCFAQDKIFKEVFPVKFTNEKLQKVHNANVDVLQRINDIESLLMKSKNNTWQTALRNPQREFYEEEGFNAKDTRTTINKTLLDNGFLLLEEYDQYWDSSSSAWVNVDKSSYTYDGNNNQIEWLAQDWDGSEWVNYTKYSYAYDVNNNKIEQIQQFWLSTISAWKFERKYSYAYDINNNQIEKIEYLWHNSDWVNYHKISSTYNGNNSLTNLLTQYWGDSVWVNDKNYKISYTYEGNNNPIEEIWLAWGDSAWSNYYKALYTYDGNNNQIEWIQQYWHDYDSAWQNLEKYIYTYDGNNTLTEELYQMGQGFVWENFLKTFYTYDVNNNQIEALVYQWVGFEWVLDYKGSNTYDGNNNQIEALWQSWDGSDWVNAYKTIYSYIPTDVTEITGEFNDYSLSNNFPNPFNPTTTIKYQIPERNFVSIKVFDILGKEIEALVNEEKSKGTYDISWNAAKQSSGIYFYQIKCGSFNQTKKMLLLK